MQNDGKRLAIIVGLLRQTSPEDSIELLYRELEGIVSRMPRVGDGVPVMLYDSIEPPIDYDGKPVAKLARIGPTVETSSAPGRTWFEHGQTGIALLRVAKEDTHAE